MLKKSVVVTLGMMCLIWGTTVKAQGREAVFYVQTKLNNAGYDVGQPDGIAGRRTRSALAEMGAKMGFEATPEAMLSFFQERYYRVAKDIRDEKDFAAVKRPFEDILLDPYSAQYKDVVIMPTGNICGYVNAKNSYGAYVGYHRFFALSIVTKASGKDELYVFSASVDDADSNRAEYFCILDMAFGSGD